jgi:hypothetical protein
MDVDEDEVPEHHADSRVRLFPQQVEERRHGVPHRVPVQRHMHRLADIDLAVTVARQIAGLQQADGDARREQFSIPRAVVRVRDLSRIYPLQNFAEAFLHSLKGLPVAPRRHGVSLFALALVGFRVPRTAADALDERGRDSIAPPGSATPTPFADRLISLLFVRWI